jgi:hypothetical protein
MSLEEAISIDNTSLLLNLKRVASHLLDILDWFVRGASEGRYESRLGGTVIQVSMSVLASSALECLANIALLIGRPFRGCLQQVLYTLLELSVLHQRAIAQVAAASTITRIAGYCGYSTSHQMFR